MVVRLSPPAPALRSPVCDALPWSPLVFCKRRRSSAIPRVQTLRPLLSSLARRSVRSGPAETSLDFFLFLSSFLLWIAQLSRAPAREDLPRIHVLQDLFSAISSPLGSRSSFRHAELLKFPFSFEVCIFSSVPPFPTYGVLRSSEHPLRMVPCCSSYRDGNDGDRPFLAPSFRDLCHFLRRNLGSRPVLFNGVHATLFFSLLLTHKRCAFLTCR